VTVNKVKLTKLRVVEYAVYKIMSRQIMLISLLEIIHVTRTEFYCLMTTVTCDLCI